MNQVLDVRHGVRQQGRHLNGDRSGHPVIGDRIGQTDAMQVLGQEPGEPFAALGGQPVVDGCRVGFVQPGGGADVHELRGQPQVADRRLVPLAGGVPGEETVGLDVDRRTAGRGVAVDTGGVDSAGIGHHEGILGAEEHPRTAARGIQVDTRAIRAGAQNAAHGAAVDELDPVVIELHPGRRTTAAHGAAGKDAAVGDGAAETAAGMNDAGDGAAGNGAPVGGAVDRHAVEGAGVDVSLESGAPGVGQVHRVLAGRVVEPETGVVQDEMGRTGARPDVERVVGGGQAEQRGAAGGDEREPPFGQLHPATGGCGADGGAGDGLAVDGGGADLVAGDLAGNDVTGFDGPAGDLVAGDFAGNDVTGFDLPTVDPVAGEGGGLDPVRVHGVTFDHAAFDVAPIQPLGGDAARGDALGIHEPGGDLGRVQRADHRRGGGDAAGYEAVGADRLGVELVGGD